MSQEREWSRVSRRDFLKQTALVGAGLAAAGAIVGCSKAGASAEGITWDKETDVVVVGSGSAVFAAFAAKDAGASVIVLEKSEIFGGAAALSGGAFWVPMNYLMKKDGIEDNRDDAIKYALKNAGGQANPEVLESYIDRAAEFIDWTVEKMGFQWGYLSGVPVYGPKAWMDYSDLPGFRPYGRSLTLGGTTVGVSASAESYGGPFTWKVMREMIDKKDSGIELLLGAEAKELFTNSAGEVIGVLVTGADGETKIHAKKGVILGTGGFDFNDAMREAYLRNPMYTTIAAPTCTGDGHRMGAEIGAEFDNMQSVWCCGGWFEAEPEEGKIRYNIPQFDAPLYRAKPNAIMVNRHGERFVNESSPYHNFGRGFEVWDSYKFEYRNIPAFFIGDATFRQYYAMPGVPQGTFGHVDDDKMPKGYVVADTLEELATKLGIDAIGLAATVEEFNKNAKAGVDPEFHRGEWSFDIQTGADFTGRTDLVNPCLGPVETPPFYGYRFYPGMLGTSGGLKINAKAQVVNREGEVIPRLYAVGNCCSGVFGSGYPGAGSTVAAGAVMSWIAAEDVVKLDELA